MVEHHTTAARLYHLPSLTFDDTRIGSKKRLHVWRSGWIDDLTLNCYLLSTCGPIYSSSVMTGFFRLQCMGALDRHLNPSRGGARGERINRQDVICPQNEVGGWQGCQIGREVWPNLATLSRALSDGCVCVDRLLCNNRSLAVLLCYVIFFFDTLEQPTYVTFVFLKLKVLVQI